jgi:hypothetical protein
MFVRDESYLLKKLRVVSMKGPSVSKSGEEGAKDNSSIPKSPAQDSDKELGFQKQPMVDWFSPSQLAQTGLRAVISSIFGSYADKREIQAALTLRDDETFFVDFSEKENLWVDYVSDLGSGWNSTYSVAYLLGRKKLQVVDSKGTAHVLPRGNILVMGGDEVYPTATWKEYNNRLIGPYRCSLPYVPEEEDPPSLFAVPGNHDWYDGLTSFIKLICQKRWLGGWKTRQSRSYFAVKLPHNWWLWGLDIQLHADIDKPQLDYFDEIQKNMGKADKVILCTAEPVWVYQEYQRDDKPFKNLDFFLNRYTKKKDKTIDFRLVLAGDLHHYTSFKSSSENNSNWKITAGGGGAFTHPTHQIPKKLTMGDETYSQSAAYPSGKESRKLAWRNLLFPFINRSFGIFFAVIYLLETWLIGVGSNLSNEGISILEELASITLNMPGLALQSYGAFLFINPASAILLIIVFAGIVAFADTKRKDTVGSWILGIFHGLLQIAAILLAVWITSKLVLDAWSIDLLSVKAIALFLLLMSILGWLFSGFVMGAYLLTATLILKTHDTEAFSSLKGEDYKNFLRLNISREGLRIFPLKIPKACREWKFNAEEEGESPWYVPVENLDYGLIEDPINITNP